MPYADSPKWLARERQDVSRTLLPAGTVVELDLVLLVADGEGFRAPRSGWQNGQSRREAKGAGPDCCPPRSRKKSAISPWTRYCGQDSGSGQVEIGAVEMEIRTFNRINIILPWTKVLFIL